LAARQKSDPTKLALAARLRQETMLSVKQIAERVELGKPKGALSPDGMVALKGRPAVPPGRVRVRLESMPEPGSEPERPPNAPWHDENAAAPFDLPRPSAIEHVTLREVNERLPERFAYDEEWKA
jgi:hypothetical protein